MFKKMSTFLLILPLLMGETVAAQDSDSLSIVASHSILADVVANVAGDHGAVTSLMPFNADPHTFTPQPQDIVGLVDADVVFINGALFEEGLLDTIENAGADINIVTVSQCVEILAFGGEHEADEDEHEADEDEHEADEDEHEADEASQGNASFAAQCDSHDHELESLMQVSDEEDEESHHAERLGRLYRLDCGEGHEHEEAGEAGAHEEEAGSCDPHVWTNPQNVMYWTLMIRDTFSALDPDNAEAYAANAAAYLGELAQLYADLHDMADSLPQESRVLVTSHDTLAYFADAFDFEIVGTVIPSASTAAEPTAADLAGLIDVIQQTGVPAVFAENTMPSDLVEQVGDETGVRVLLLYSDSLSDGDPAATYIDLMRFNMQTIVDGLSQ